MDRIKFDSPGYEFDSFDYDGDIYVVPAEDTALKLLRCGDIEKLGNIYKLIPSKSENPEHYDFEEVKDPSELEILTKHFLNTIAESN